MILRFLRRSASSGVLGLRGWMKNKEMQQSLDLLISIPESEYSIAISC